jgi:methyl-accepting chemotaxis protein
MKSRRLSTRFTILLSAVFLIGVVVSYIALSNALIRRVQEDVNNKSLILVNLMNSVRSYTSDHIAPLLAPVQATSAKFIPETVPAFSAREIFEKLRQQSDYKYFFYKEATLNPTNPRDHADDFEAEIVKRFQDTPVLTEVTGYRNLNGVETFYSARPFVIKNEACLVCHSTPDKAPPALIATYGDKNGFGWKLNDTIATQIIYIPAETIIQIARDSTLVVMSVFGLIFIVALFVINVTVRHFVVRPITFMGEVARRVAAGELNFTTEERAQMAEVAKRPDEIGQALTVFQTMTQEVKKREDRLTAQVQKLKIDVDEARKAKAVSEITDTEYFQNLRAKAKALRGTPTDPGPSPSPAGD